MKKQKKITPSKKWMAEAGIIALEAGISIVVNLVVTLV